MKIYLAGPMTGLPEFNYPAFHEAAKALREKGHEVYNPAEYKFDGDLKDFPLREAFKEYVAYLADEAEAICLLHGWQESAGARVENGLATVFGLTILRYMNGNFVVMKDGRKKL